MKYFVKIFIRVATGQGKVREKVREFWNFVESQGNLRKVREIKHDLYFIRCCGDQYMTISISKDFPLAASTLVSYFSTHFILNLPFVTQICYLNHKQACTP